MLIIDSQCAVSLWKELDKTLLDILSSFNQVD